MFLLRFGEIISIANCAAEEATLLKREKTSN
jgi:hypothetical protein